MFKKKFSIWLSLLLIYACGSHGLAADKDALEIVEGVEKVLKLEDINSKQLMTRLQKRWRVFDRVRNGGHDNWSRSSFFRYALTCQKKGKADVEVGRYRLELYAKCKEINSRFR